MAKKICRTCLKRTISTFKTHETLSNPDEHDKLKISDVLRYLVPELYLGVTTCPEICSDCRCALRSAYLFRKQCLHTENLIGTYLKNDRCTARSVDLYDVLDFIGNQQSLKPLETKSIDETVESNAQKIISDWEDDCSEGSNLESWSVGENKEKNILNNTENVTSNTENIISNMENVIDTQHNTVSADNPRKDIIRVRTNLFRIDDVFTLFENDEYEGNSKIHEKEKNATEEKNEAIKKPLPTPFPKDKTLKKLLEGPKIVFAQNNSENLNVPLKTTNLPVIPIAPKPSPSELTKKTNFNTVKDTSIDIKDEPLDLDRNDHIPPTDYQYDEDTLTAPESTVYNEVHGIINNVPEMYNSQYVDVPDFVQINNFSLTDFEQLRQFQEVQKTNRSVTQLIPLPPGTFSVSGNTIFQTNQNQVFQTVINSNKVMSSENNICLTNLDLLNNPSNSTTMYNNKMSPTVYLTSVPQQVNTSTIVRPVRKRRRKIKLVPVPEIESDEKKEDKFKDVDRDVCVLFTNYTVDGVYVNDHDYLIAPYKRNKILYKDNENWVCMCFICGYKHPVDEHVDHMMTHESICSLCKANLGTPYMLNIHMRSHEKPCKFCTEKVQYADKEKHDLKHLEEDRQYEIEKVKRYHWSKRGRKKQDKDEKPVYFQIKLGSDSEKEIAESPRLRNSLTIESTSEEKEEVVVDIPKTEPEPLIIQKRRGKKRKLSFQETEEAPAERRVLRSDAKKTEIDDNKTDIIK